VDSESVSHGFGILGRLFVGEGEMNQFDVVFIPEYRLPDLALLLRVAGMKMRTGYGGGCEGWWVATLPRLK